RRPPEDDCLPEGGTCEPEGPHPDEQEPGPDRDQMEDTDEVVRRRVMRALFVLVVEPIEARDDDPHREAPERGHDELPVRSEQETDDGERGGETDEVREHEHAPDQPPSPFVDDASLVRELLWENRVDN